MKREILFRAWDNFNEEYHYSDDNYLKWFPLRIFHENINNFIYEQYTGLKDKNGKKIFEGDILEFVGGTTFFLPCMGHISNGYSVGEKVKVAHLKSGFTLQPLSLNSDIPNVCGNVNNYDFWNNSRSLIVIGNIHENI